MLKIANHTLYYKQLARTLVEAVRDYPMEKPVVLTIHDKEIVLCCDLHQQTTCLTHSFLERKLVQRSLQKKQMLLKACNNKKRAINSVVDLTAGWGKDSFILATHGQKVTMVEQNALIFHCLQYLLGVAIAEQDSELLHRLQLVHMDGCDYLSELQDNLPDCLYIDPMFPAHKSGARPGKDLQILQLLTTNLNMDSLLELALTHARHRVVVKRPLHGPPLNGRKADIIYREKTIRFDVYLTTNL